MARELKVLQIGGTNWLDLYSIPKENEWTYVPFDSAISYLSKIYQSDKGRMSQIDLILLPEDCLEWDEDYNLISQVVDAYRIVYNQNADYHDSFNQLFYSKRAISMDLSNPQELIPKLNNLFFAGQYGEKYSVNSGVIASSFKGSIQYNGKHYIHLQGDFGEKFQQIFQWKRTPNVASKEAIELWPEFEKDEAVSLRYVIHMYHAQMANKRINTYYIEGNDLEKPLIIQAPDDADVSLSLSLEAKGEGKLTISSMHSRYSRYGLFQNLLGGHRVVNSKRQEFFYLSHPGDLKPPLNVYFSGFRTQEGFEGYYMMRSLGAPFLLITDPRFDGGGFYIGDAEYEAQITKVIIDTLASFGFKNDQLILSGMSMGTFGATYYGADLNPNAIILGKPVFHLEDVADQLRVHRPDDFSTSLDLVNYYKHDLMVENGQQLNNFVRNKIKSGNYEGTTIAVAHMLNEDYDRHAFQSLQNLLQDSEAIVIGKGFEGRHNDGATPVRNWFISQYRRILREQFNR